jgi:hypothetical protein
MAIEEKIQLDADSGSLDAAASAADALAEALGHVETNAVKASKGIANAANAAKASLQSAKAGAAGGMPSVPKGAVPKAAKEVQGGEPVKASKGKGFDEIWEDIQKEEKQKTALKAKEATKQKEINKDLKKKGDAARAERMKADKDSFGKFKSALGSTFSTVAKGAALAVGGLAAIAGGLEKIGEAKIARDNIRAMLDQVTKGRGQEAFKKLDKLAKNLGATTEDVAQDFYNLRKRGLSNIDSTKVIKLKNDLMSVGVQGADVDNAVNQVTDSIIRGTNSADGAIATMAKRYGAVGDGSNAAAKSVGTVEGAFDSLKRMFDDTLGNLGDEFGPTIVDLVHTVQDAFNSMDPATVKDAIENTKLALKGLKPVIKFAVKAFELFLNVFNSVADLVQGKGVVFNELKEDWDAIKGAADTLSGAISKAWDDATKAIEDGIKKAEQPLDDAVADFKKLGGDLIQGLIDGLTAGIPGLDKPAGEAAKAFEAGVRKESQTKSPSRKMMKVGDDMVEGLVIPFRRMPDVKDTLPPSWQKSMSTARPSNDNAPRVEAEVSMSDRGRSVSVIIQKIEVNGAQSPQAVLDELEERVESAVRRALAS